MAVRPTYSSLLGRIRTDLGSPVVESVRGVLATIQAGLAHLMHGRIDYAQDQLFPDTADLEHLKRDGSLRGVTLIAATFAHVQIGVSGTAGATIPAGSEFYTDSGLGFATSADFVMPGSTAVIETDAITPGASSNLTYGTPVTLAAPLPGIVSQAFIWETTIDGAEEESTEAYRARVIARRKFQPRGGTLQDYINWALEISGVTRAWAFRNVRGLGTIDLYFVRDNDASYIPDAGEVAEVQDYIDDNYRPATADLIVYAPADTPVAHTVTLSPNTSQARDAVEAELDEAYFRLASPGGTVSLVELQAAVARGATAQGSAAVLNVPASSPTASVGQILSRGAMTYV